MTLSVKSVGDAAAKCSNRTDPDRPSTKSCLAFSYTNRSYSAPLDAMHHRVSTPSASATCRPLLKHPMGRLAWTPSPVCKRQVGMPAPVACRNGGEPRRSSGSRRDCRYGASLAGAPVPNMCRSGPRQPGRCRLEGVVGSPTADTQTPTSVARHQWASSA
jgi:hypothetical protein